MVGSKPDTVKQKAGESQINSMNKGDDLKGHHHEKRWRLWRCYGHKSIGQGTRTVFPILY